MITHKFREVMAYADDVTVLRKGRLAGSGLVAELDRQQMAAMMIGESELPQTAKREGAPDIKPVLVLKDLTAEHPRLAEGIAIERLEVHEREIVGIAGISGNGQKELVEVLAGQRPATGGEVLVEGEAYDRDPRRGAAAGRLLPARGAAAQRLRAAHVGGREPGLPPLRPPARRQAQPLARLSRHGPERPRPDRAATRSRPPSKDSPIASLSGGNVQRAVLARELSGERRSC